MDPWHAAPALEWGRRVSSSSGTFVGSFRGLKFTMNKSKSVGFFSPEALGAGGNGPDESVLAVAADLRARFPAGVKPELLQDPPQDSERIYSAASTRGSFVTLLLPPPFPASISKRFVWGRGGVAASAKHLRLRVKQSVVEALVLSSRA